ncbi:MAG: U32 family peptidase, partial [Eggerthellaceae bacterium]|nr:U32 family peptidase [Eggerthellaceae bacterium]
SYSGKRVMSSMIGGRSAYRGMCAQACRLPYELHNGSVKNAVKTEGDHLLSPKDLCSVDVLEDLIDAGVASLKIEGRMKSPEYVYEVVSVYRSVIDRIYAQRHDRTTGRGIRATGEEKDRLAQAFSRGFTRAYLDGKRSNDIMSYARPNNRGTSLGRVLSIKEGRALLKVNKPVFKGDVIEFWTKNGHEPYVVNKAEEAGKGQVAIELDKSCSKKVHAQDRVFLLRQADAQFNDDINIPKVPVEATVTCVEGQPLSMTVRIPETKDLPEDASAMEKLIAYRLHNALPEEALTAEIEAAVVEKARTKPITEDDILAHIDRLGGTPFELSGCDINAGEDAGIGFSGLHHLRADALKSLESSITKSFRHERIPKSSPLQLPDRPYAGPAVIVAWATNPVCAKAALKAGASRVYVPALNYEVAEAQIAGQVNSTAQGHGYPQDVVVAMPVASHDSSGKSREAITGFDAWKMAEGKEEVYVESLGDMQHAFDLGLTFEIGPHIPITNEASLNVACEYNAKRIWLSPELTLSQIKELGQKSPISFGITVIGRQELMTTEHCMLMSQGSCNEKCRECPRRRAPYYMKDRKGYLFPVVTDLCGRSHLYNSVMLDIAHVMPDLLSAHVGAFMVDTTFMNREETTEAVLRVKRALKIAQNEGNCVGKAPDTTSGHLFRGVA